MRFLFILIFFIAALNSSKVFSQYEMKVERQRDLDEDQIFLSETISEELLNNFELRSSYYTIKDNISNKASSAYVTDNPNKGEYLKFARELPSYYFTVHNKSIDYFLIMPFQKIDKGELKYLYFVKDIKNNKIIEFPCTVTGAITEKRAEELTGIKIDSNAKIYSESDMKIFEFDNAKYKVQDYENLKTEVRKIVGELLSKIPQKKKPANIEEITAYIKKESVSGGELDFLESLSPGKLYVIDKIAYNDEEAVALKWGEAVAELGITDEDEAILLWEEIYKKNIESNIQKALLRGFNSVDK